jgi:hypothetical protein
MMKRWPKRPILPLQQVAEVLSAGVGYAVERCPLARDVTSREPPNSQGGISG